MRVIFQTFVCNSILALVASIREVVKARKRAEVCVLSRTCPAPLYKHFVFFRQHMHAKTRGKKLVRWYVMCVHPPPPIKSISVHEMACADTKRGMRRREK